MGLGVFEDRLKAASDAVDAVFADWFGRLDGRPLLDAMRHATQGGKRFRAFLVMEGARLHGVDPDAAALAASAVEAIHAYSLVHDDLPAMDDDDMRRGQPTVHVKWDEATAILVGDGLQALAFEMLAGIDAGSDARVHLVAELARASGPAGMVCGQALDIAAETAEPRYGLEMVEETQALKTGALIEWSAAAGPVLAGADPTGLRRYAAALGRAFQIADDILDVEGDAEAAGKRLGKDAAAGKATFVSLLGLEGARRLAEDKVTEACASLAPYGDAAECLRQAARFVIARKS